MRDACVILIVLLQALSPLVLRAQSTTPAAADTSRPSFADFLAGVRTEALARGIRQDIVDEALGAVEEPLPVVIERDRTQAETVLSLEKYVSRRLTKRFVQ